MNLSSTTIPEDIQCFLQLGEKFSFPVQHVSLQRNIFIKFVEANFYKMDPLISQEIRNNAIHIINHFLSSPPPLTDLNRDILVKARRTKSFLLNNPNLLVTRADKGNSTVVLDRDVYLKKMNELLSDEATYIRVEKDPTKKISNELKTLLTKWHKNDYISISTYRYLHPGDGVLSRAYGLPKIHKQNFPIIHKFS